MSSQEWENISGGEWTMRSRSAFSPQESEAHAFLRCWARRLRAILSTVVHKMLVSRHHWAPPSCLLSPSISQVSARLSVAAHADRPPRTAPAYPRCWHPQPGGAQLETRTLQYPGLPLHMLPHLPLYRVASKKSCFFSARKSFKKATPFSCVVKELLDVKGWGKDKTPTFFPAPCTN